MLIIFELYKLKIIIPNKDIILSFKLWELYVIKRWYFMWCTYVNMMQNLSSTLQVSVWIPFLPDLVLHFTCHIKFLLLILYYSLLLYYCFSFCYSFNYCLLPTVAAADSKHVYTHYYFSSAILSPHLLILISFIIFHNCYSSFPSIKKPWIPHFLANINHNSPSCFFS